MNQQLAFRQLTEQLWQAGLPTAPTTSIRSRCSSAPPSERGGDADETIDWDEPDTPDEGNELLFRLKRMGEKHFYA